VRYLSATSYMGESDLKPLTNAEFHRLLRELDRYNGCDEDAQISMFSSTATNNLDFEFLPEVDEAFLRSELLFDSELSGRITALLKRNTAVSFEIERLESIAKIVTVFDADYPEKLKSKLRNMPDSLREPALLYYCGELSLQNLKYIGFVGARDIDVADSEWTKAAVRKIFEKSENDGTIIGVVSGGAEGVDRISENTAIELSMPIIEFSKNMKNSLENMAVIDAVQEQRMLLFSEVNPLRRLTKYEATAHFMNRNKFIYAMSEYTIVVKSAKGPKSGTWTGAKEAIERNLCDVYVRKAPYEGNIDLIEMGGIEMC